LSILISLPAILTTQSLPAQSSQVSEELLRDFGRPRFMILLFEAEPGTLTETDEFILYNSILTAVAAANRDVVILESPDPDVPRTKPGKEELARRVNADSWLHVVATGGFDNLTLQVETFDILRQETFGSELIRPGFRVDYRIISRGFWDNLVQTIADEYARIVDLTTVTVDGVPGSRIEGVPGGPYEIGENGEAVLDVPYPSAFTLRVTQGGFYDVEQPVFVGIDPITLSLDQTEKPTLGFDLRLSSLQFPGFKVWYYAVPAELYFRAGVVTQLAGFYFIDNAPRVLVTGGSLSLVSLDWGIYATPAETLFRAYGGLGGYLRVTHPPASFGLDRAGAIGAVTATIGGEYSPSRRLRFFVEYQPGYIITNDPQQFIDVSFVTNRFPSGRVPGFLVFDYGLIDLRDVYLGVRLDF
jgi:hypothetical protein